MYYKSIRNVIVDETGKEIATILAVNCTKRDASMMASFAAQQMNHEQRNKERRNEQK